MKKVLSSILFLLISSYGFSQSNLFGTVMDEVGSPLPSATVVLLDPADSTLLHFGITNARGDFEIKNIGSGNYLLQVAYIGYKTFYAPLEMPYKEMGNIGAIILAPNPVAMDEVQVSGERIPLQIRKDTVEYDAKAFKTSSDAVAEDLLKKLPGIEVDRAGNIKAMGEDVNNVLVDGKEFFSGDPKVATKNLPADAIDKVQVYNKKTEEAEFTGIDDGARNQTINLLLDEDKKQGVFGEVQGGLGAGDLQNGLKDGLHYDTRAKVYKFTGKSQIAALGMLNNVNKYGFSFGDYLSFTGGIANISHGKGQFSVGGDGFPINFGETVKGDATSGAAGLNFSHFKSKYQRFFISYLGSGSERSLTEQVKSTRYTDAGTYLQDENSSQVQHDTAHNVNFGIRYLFRETNNIIMNGGVSYSAGYIPLSSTEYSYNGTALVNEQNRTSFDNSGRLSGNINGTYLKKINEGSTILKVFGNGSYMANNADTRFENQTSYYSPVSSMLISQFQENRIISGNYGGGIAFTQKLFEAFYMDISVQASATSEQLTRRQGETAASEMLIDSLSPDFSKITRSLLPGLTLKRNMEKSTMSLGLDYQLGGYETSLWSDDPDKTNYNNVLPRFSWEYSYKTGRRLAAAYNTSVNTPSVNQLMPVVNNFNSLSLFYGNRDLQPEYNHSVMASWWIFDQFSFTTLMTSLRASYTSNKINYARTVNDQFQQIVRLVNVDSDFSASASADFTTPIRFLGIKTNIDLAETYSRGINIVNGIENEVTSVQHRLFVTFDNRKKVKWDVLTGAGLTLTDADYSIQQSLNNVYYDLSWFGEIRYNPTEHFEFFVSADITNYTARSFETARLVPLLTAEINYFFMENNRATLTLSGFDLLDKNTGISRISEMNYLEERQSNIIGRYFMLTFKYRLNKVGGDTGFNVNIKKR